MTSLQQHQELVQNLGIRRNSNTHQSFLATKTISHVLAHVKASKRPLLDLPVTATFEQTFELLLAEDILSVPVYQLNGPEQSKDYIAIVNILDLMKLLDYPSTSVDTHFFQRQLKDVIGQTDSRLVTVETSDALMDVLSLLTEQGAYQVLVNKKDDPQVILLSQLDILYYLQSHNHHLGSILDQTVPQLVTKTQQVKKMTYKTTGLNVIESLDPLLDTLAIVDDEGYLVSDIGPQDLRGLTKTGLKELSKPVLMFLKSMHGGALVAPFTCHGRFTLSQLMAAFVLRKVDRLWWINQDGHIQGVITPIHILNAFLN